MQSLFVSYAQLTVSPLVIPSQPITCPCIQHGEVLDFRVPHRLFKHGNKGDEGSDPVARKAAAVGGSSLTWRLLAVNLTGLESINSHSSGQVCEGN